MTRTSITALALIALMAGSAPAASQIKPSIKQTATSISQTPDLDTPGQAQEPASKHGFGAMVHLGFDAEGDADSLDCKKGCQGSLDVDDEDLESLGGITMFYEYSLSEQLRLGARLALTSAEGDESMQEMGIADLGIWGRYSFNVQKDLSLYLATGAGVTAAQTEVDNSRFSDLSGKTKYEGTGYHFLAGAGATYQVSSSIQLIGGVFYNAQRIEAMEGSTNGFDIEFSDVAISSTQVQFGVLF